MVGCPPALSMARGRAGAPRLLVRVRVRNRVRVRDRVRVRVRVRVKVLLDGGDLALGPPRGRPGADVPG